MLDINTIVYQLPITVDSTRLLDELNTLVVPRLNLDVIDDLKNIKATSISITSRKNQPADRWYQSNYNRTMTSVKDMSTGEVLPRMYNKYTLGFPGAWRDNVEGYYDDGIGDRSLCHWPPDLADSEIYNFSRRITQYFNIDTPLRCRASFIHGYRKMTFHSDPHTPWRVHVNLKSGPGTRWLFRTVEPEETIEWIQPKDSVWLVRTGDVQHAVEVPEDEIRWQLFYHLWQRDLGPRYHQIT